MRTSLIALPLAAILAGAAPGIASAAPAPRAAIPFANHGGVWTWTAVGNDTIYFQDAHRAWYRAVLFAPAFDLPFIHGLRIDTGPMGTLDKWGAVYIDGRRYPFQSFERASGPPPRARDARKGKS